MKQTDKRLFWFNTVFVNGTKIDMAEVLKYPLTAVPLCLSHVHGSVNSTPKWNLLNYIDSQFVTVPPSSIDATIIDGAFFCTCK